ncbi:MAG: hypothetical protein IPF79_04565 [Ignavibacteria bacterium]|nr:hypothetical protein [Ignavibacteria bacterium]
MWLRYKYNSADVYSYVWITDAHRRERPLVVREQSESLRKNIQVRTFSRRTIYDVTFSPLSLVDPAKMTALKTFFGAVVTEIHPTSTAVGSQPASGWVAVSVDGGELPVEYVEDIDLLPEVTLTFTALSGN